MSKRIRDKMKIWAKRTKNGQSNQTNEWYTEYNKLTKRPRRSKTKPKNTFADQYSKPQWYKRRKEILVRDNFSCTVCGCKHNLQVHHKIYDRSLKVWEYEGKYLTTLCQPCHEYTHSVTPISSLYNTGRPLAKYTS